MKRKSTEFVSSEKENLFVKLNLIDHQIDKMRLVTQWSKPQPKQFHIINHPELTFKLARINTQTDPNLPQTQFFQQKISALKVKRGKSAVRSKYFGLKEELLELEKVLHGSIDLKVSQLFEYKQVLLVEYLQPLIKDLDVECLEKSNFLKHIWNSFIQICDELFGRLRKQQKSDEKSHLKEEILIHEHYQNMMQKLKMENQRFKEEQIKYERLAKELMNSIQMLNIEVKFSKQKMESVVSNLKEMSHRYNELKYDHIDLLMNGCAGNMNQIEAECLVNNRQCLQVAATFMQKTTLNIKRRDRKNHECTKLDMGADVNTLLQQFEDDNEFSVEEEFLQDQPAHFEDKKVQTHFVEPTTNKICTATNWGYFEQMSESTKKDKSAQTNKLEKKYFIDQPTQYDHSFIKLNSFQIISSLIDVHLNEFWGTSIRKTTNLLRKTTTINKPNFIKTQSSEQIDEVEFMNNDLPTFSKTFHAFDQNNVKTINLKKSSKQLKELKQSKELKQMKSIKQLKVGCNQLGLGEYVPLGKQQPQITTGICQENAVQRISKADYMEKRIKTEENTRHSIIKIRKSVKEEKYSKPNDYRSSIYKPDKSKILESFLQNEEDRFMGKNKKSSRRKSLIKNLVEEILQKKSRFADLINESIKNEFSHQMDFYSKNNEKLQMKGKNINQAEANYQILQQISIIASLSLKRKKNSCFSLAKCHQIIEQVYNEAINQKNQGCLEINLISILRNYLQSNEGKKWTSLKLDEKLIEILSSLLNYFDESFMIRNFFLLSGYNHKRLELKREKIRQNLSRKIGKCEIGMNNTSSDFCQLGQFGVEQTFQRRHSNLLTFWHNQDLYQTSNSQIQDLSNLISYPKKTN